MLRKMPQPGMQCTNPILTCRDVNVQASAGIIRDGNQAQAFEATQVMSERFLAEHLLWMYSTLARLGLAWLGLA